LRTINTYKTFVSARIWTLAVVILATGIIKPVLAQESGDEITISSGDIETMNVMKIHDVLNRVPGIKASETSVSIRGSSNVMVFMDGRPINDKSTSAGAVKWDMISLETIERIEIYKNKGGAIYGDNTSGGVIVITSKKITRFNGNAESFYGRFDHTRLKLNLQGQQKNVGMGLSAGYETEDGFTANSDKTQWRVDGKTIFHASQAFSIGLSVGYNTIERGMRGLPEYRTPNSRNEYQMATALLSADYNQLESRTYFDWNETVNRDPDRNLFNTFSTQRLGEKLILPLTVGELGKFTFGSGLEWEEAYGSAFKDVSEMRSWLFALKSFQPTSLPLNVSLGVRGNFYSEFPNEFNPEFKVSSSFERLHVDASINRTNNTPTFKQRYNETSSTKPNLNLKPETAINMNLNFQFKLLKNLRATLSGFYSRITNRITYVTQDEGWGRYQNFGRVTYMGTDASISWQVTPEIELRPAYIYLHAKNEETGYWLPAKPFHRITGDVVLKPIEPLSMTFYFKYDSRTYSRSDNSKSLVPYWIMNYRADYRLGFGQVYLDIQNLFDKTYYYIDGYDAPPLEWALGFNYKF